MSSNIGYRSRSTSLLDTNKVLRNTYALLSMTLVWSAITAGIAISTAATPMGWGGALLMFALLFGVMFTANSGLGLIMTFAFTGFMGYFIGPAVGQALELSNGPQIVATALGGTGAIFLTLSGYVLTTKKDFSFMGGFLFVALLGAIVLMIANIFMGLAMLDTLLSYAVILIMSGYILFDTSRIIHGGETNYIRATISLYLDILNIFLHLLSLLSSD